MHNIDQGYNMIKTKKMRTTNPTQVLENRKVLQNRTIIPLSV